MPDFAVPVIGRADEARPRFSICTLITRPAEYGEMVKSFVSHGFTPSDCEFLYIDNSETNCFDAFRGNNLFLSQARGDFVVLCHQDILLLEDGRAELECRLDELTALDPRWALCGNAGGVSFIRLAVHISDPRGADRFSGPLPARVTALDENFLVVLDENFLVVRREANLGLSQDLSGFHFYGADLCIIADFLGGSAWAIDFHLLHKSSGTTGSSFYSKRMDVARKYQRAFRVRPVVTPVTYLFLSGSPLLNRLFNARIVRYVVDNFVVRQVSKGSSTSQSQARKRGPATTQTLQHPRQY